MSANGGGGILMFGPQYDMGYAVGPVASPKWFAHRAADINLTPQDDQRVMPAEVGGKPLPGGAYKAGIVVAGGMTLYPRLQNSLGWLLQGAMGKLAATTKAVIPEAIMANKLVTAALQTINTGLGTVPTGGRKISVRLLKSDSLSGLRPTITVTGTDASDQAQTETYNFDTGPAGGGTPQRAVGMDTDPASATTGWETIVGYKDFKTVTSVAIPAYASIGTNKAWVAVGFEDAVANQHDFELDSADPSMVKWMGLRKYVPKASQSGNALGELYKDCKITGIGFTFPNDGLISARVDVLGRMVEMETDPSWASNPSFENYESIPIGSVPSGYLRVPYLPDDGELSVLNASVGWVNTPEDLRMQRVFGSPYLDDVDITTRQLTVDLTVKYKSPELYRLVLGGSRIATEWSAIPFTTRLDVFSLSPTLMTGSLLPFGLRCQAERVMLGLRGGIELVGRNTVTMRFTGVALDMGGTYARMSLTNLMADTDYAWPTD